MAYAVLLILGAAYPRRRDHFLEDRVLKRHLINLCAEWTVGIQPRCLDESHWIIRGDGHVDRKHGVLPKTKPISKPNLGALSNDHDLLQVSSGQHWGMNQTQLPSRPPRIPLQ